MEKELNDYLEKVEKHLKPLPVSERIDIVQEIKSEILELRGEGRSAEDIFARLGDPRELAKAYLGDLIAKSETLTRNRVLAICAYYSLAGLSGLIVIPVLGICAPVFLACGAITPILGAIKLLDTCLHLGIPFVDQIMIAGVQSPLAVFLLCVVTGVLLLLMGWGCWKLLVGYIKAVSKTKEHLAL